MAAAGGRGGRGRGLWARVDWPAVALWLALAAYGWVSVCGACFDPAGGEPLLSLSARPGLQLVWLGTSLLLALALLLIDERAHDALAYVIYALAMLLLLVTPLLARDIKGSLSWIKVGQLSVQPAEFAKYATALCLAKYMGRPGFAMARRRGLPACLALILLPAALIVMQRETGCALVYLCFLVPLYREGMPGAVLAAGGAAVAYFVMGTRWAGLPVPLVGRGDLGAAAVGLLAYLLTALMAAAYAPPRRAFPLRAALLWGAGLALTALALCLVTPWASPTTLVMALPLGLAAWLLWQAAARRAWAPLVAALFALGSLGFHWARDRVMDDILEPHQRARVLVLLGMEDDPRGAGYNVIQAKIAIGSGGLRGKGFLRGTQTKLRYVPEQDTDFIFCTVGEEQGFAGAAAVLLLFLALALRLIALAERQRDTMGRVYGYCVASVLLFHLLVNVGMVLGLMPVIGIPLPFFSYGGSSLWGFTLLLFVFLRMDAGGKRRRP